MKRFILYLCFVLIFTNLYSQNYKVSLVPVQKGDSLYVAYVLSYASYPVLPPTIGGYNFSTKIDESYIDVSKGKVKRPGRYSDQYILYKGFYSAPVLTYVSTGISQFSVNRLTTFITSPPPLSIVNNDTLGIVVYPIKRCFQAIDLNFSNSTSKVNGFYNWQGTNFTSSEVQFVDFVGQVPRIKYNTTLSADKVCINTSQSVSTQAIGSSYVLLIYRLGVLVDKVQMTSNTLSVIVAGKTILDGDKLAITYTIKTGCSDTTILVPVSVVSNCCDPAFTKLSSSYCIAGFSVKLVPNSPGGVFVGPGVYYNPLLKSWIFNPRVAGAGTHTITYTLSAPSNCAISSSSQTVTVDPVPCRAQVSNVLSNVTIPKPTGLFTNCYGEVFIASSDQHVVYKIDTFGVKSIYAGDTIPATPREGNVNSTNPLFRPILCQPIGIVGSSNGDIYVADGGAQCVVKIEYATGMVSTIAGLSLNSLNACGSGSSTGSVFGSFGVSRFNNVYGLTINKSEDTIYVSESSGNKITGIELKTGSFQTFLLAGSTTNAFGSNNGPGVSATFNKPQHISITGNYLYVADMGNNMVRRIDLSTRRVITLAGKVKKLGDPNSLIDVDTSKAILNKPSAVTADCDGNTYVVEPNNNWILRVNQLNNTMTVTRFAGDANQNSGNTSNTFDQPQAISIYTKGFIDVADFYNDRIVRVAIDDWSDNVFKGLDSLYCLSTKKDTITPQKCSGSMYCVEDPTLVGTITKNGVTSYTFTPSKAGLFTISYTFISGKCTQTVSKKILVVKTKKPVLGPDLNICDSPYDLKVKNPNFDSYTWFKNGALVPSSAGVLNISPQFTGIQTVVLNSIDSNACASADTIKLTKITTVLANVQLVSSVRDTLCFGMGQRLTAIFANPADSSKYHKLWNTNAKADTTTGLFVNNSAKYIFTITDKLSPACTKSYSKNIVYKNQPQSCFSLVNNATGAAYSLNKYVVSTLANTTITGSKPYDLVYRNGDIYIADAAANKIRRYNIATKVMSDFIGDGAAGITDSLLRGVSKVSGPTSIVFDKVGNLYICNSGANCISKYVVATNRVYVIAGNMNSSGFSDGLGMVAMFNKPTHLEIDGLGNLYVTDNLNNVIRKLSPSLNSRYYNVVTVTGDINQNPGAVNGGPKVAKFNYPWGVAMDNEGQLAIAEDLNHVIRKINLDTVTALVAGQFGVIGHNPVVNAGLITGSSALFNKPWGLVTNNQGYIYVADGVNNAIKRIDKQGNVQTLTGLGSIGGGVVDGGVAVAKFNKPTAISLGQNSKTFYVSDRDNGAIRRLRRVDTAFVCKSDLGKINYSYNCPSPNIFVRYFTKSARVSTRDSLITNVVNNSITVTRPGIYITEVRDSIPNYCSSVYRDTLWILGNPEPIITLLKPSSFIFCMDQELKFKVVSNPALDNKTKYTFSTPLSSGSVPQLYNTPIVNDSGVFNIKLTKSILSKSTQSFVSFEYRITIVDSNNCNLISSPPPAILIVDNTLGITDAKDTSVCRGDVLNMKLRQRVANSTSLRINYLWKPTTSIVSSKDSIVGSTRYTIANVKSLTPQKITVIQTNTTSRCADSVSFNIAIRPSPNVVATSDTGLCGGSGGSITLNASVIPGISAGPFKTTWYNMSLPSDSTVASSKTVSPSTTTKYKVKVVGGNGCAAYDTTQVGVGIPPVAKILLPTKDTTICPSDSLILRGTASGGKPFNGTVKYKYEWKSLSDNSVKSTLAGFRYKPSASSLVRFVARDSVGCFSADTIVVNITQFKISGGQVDTAICYGETIKAKSVLASGSTSYTYLWNKTVPLLDNNTLVNPLFKPVDTLANTTYILTVTDNFGCKLRDTVKIKLSTLPKANIISLLAYCQGQPYFISSSVLGGTKPYKYTWSEPATQNLGVSSSDTAKIKLIPNVSGSSFTLNLQVTDSVQCKSKLASNSFKVLAAPYIDLGSDTVICDGVSISKSAFSNQNAALSIAYIWFKDGVDLGNPTPAQVLDTSGIYKVSLISSEGCRNQDSIKVTSKLKIDSISILPLNVACKGAQLRYKLQIVGGTPDYEVTWTTNGLGSLRSPVNKTISSQTDSTVYFSSVNDQTIIKVSATVVGSCNTISIDNSQSLNVPPIAVISGYSPSSIYISQPVTFTQSSIFDKQLSWDFGDGTSILKDNSSSVSHTYQLGGKIPVVLTAENSNQCITRDTLMIDIINNQNIFIPNVFNPGSLNPENNKIKIYCVNIVESGFDFTIFNRWGQVVYHSNSYSETNLTGWNGKLNNTGEELSLGTYTYSLKGKFGDGKEFGKVGTITLVK